MLRLVPQDSSDTQLIKMQTENLNDCDSDEFFKEFPETDENRISESEIENAR